MYEEIWDQWWKEEYAAQGKCMNNIAKEIYEWSSLGSDSCTGPYAPIPVTSFDDQCPSPAIIEPICCATGTRNLLTSRKYKRLELNYQWTQIKAQEESWSDWKGTYEQVGWTLLQSKCRRPDWRVQMWQMYEIGIQKMCKMQEYLVLL